MFLGQFFVKNAKKMTLEHFSNDPNRENFENRIENRNRRKQRENGLFRPSKHQNSVIFQDTYLKLCTHIHLTGFFYKYSVFWGKNWRVLAVSVRLSRVAREYGNQKIIFRYVNIERDVLQNIFITSDAPKSY